MNVLPMDPVLAGTWAPPTIGRRWEGDDGVSPAPLLAILEELGFTDEDRNELELNEVYTIETLMLLTDADLASSFSPGVQAKVQQILGKAAAPLPLLAGVPPPATAAAAAPLHVPPAASVPQQAQQAAQQQAMPAPPVLLMVPPSAAVGLAPGHGAAPAAAAAAAAGVYGGGSLASQQTFIEIVQQLVEERERSRRVKDYTRADAIREQLRKQGIKLNDDARTWLHPNGMHATRH